MSESDKEIDEVVAKLTKDAPEFMAGYKREPLMLGKILTALIKAADRHPTLRLGQLIVALVSKQTDNYDITNFLFNVYDEDLIKLLSEF